MIQKYLPFRYTGRINNEKDRKCDLCYLLSEINARVILTYCLHSEVYKNNNSIIAYFNKQLSKLRISSCSNHTIIKKTWSFCIFEFLS